ncbi:MAG TPA: lytic transglycosylase domain-containing protein [Terracidiphilus sp.]|nr:lytic transglycosylase domain-containing protein [Terracidiphilus sp.]
MWKRDAMRTGVTICAALVVAALAAPAVTRAAERVQLRNGFTMTCDHHARVDGQVRLYLTAGADNYIALQPEEIAGYEKMDDPAAAPAQGSRNAQPVAKDAVALSPADLREMLNRAGMAHNLDVDLLASVVKAESNGQTRAVSRAGARGLMQLMPETAAGLGVQDSFNAGENVQGGSAYLDALLRRYHENLALALAAYNAGPEAVDRWHGIPPYTETQAYVARVIHAFNRRVRAREAEARPLTAGRRGGR